MSRFILSAFADEIAPELDIQMDVLKKFNMHYIEMRGVNGRPLVEYTISEVKKIRRQLDEKGFKISSIGSPIGKIKIIDDFEPHLELFKHTVEVANILESKYIRMFSFFMPKNEDPAKYRDEVMERWTRFIEAAKGAGLVLLHENEKDIYGDTPERCLDLLKTLNCTYLKAIFDPANFVQCDVETYPEAYEMLKDFIVYMHIKDALFKDRSVVPSGEGDGKVAEILKDLYKKGFDGFASLEPHLGSFTGLATLETDSKMADLPEGGPKKFGMAYNALDRILKEITA